MNWKKIDSKIHSVILERIIALGHAPRVQELSRLAEASETEVRESLRRLAENHGVVLHPESEELWVIHPFSLSPTTTWVQSDGHGWWAPCMWCAFGIANLIGEDCVIHARLGGEIEPVQYKVRNGNLSEGSYPIHFAMPPRDAWNNVHHFCACVLPFRDSAQLSAWSKRHGFSIGELVPAQQTFELARAWYGRHKNPDWIKCSVAEAQEIFRRVGLTSEFWNLGADRERY